MAHLNEANTANYTTRWDVTLANSVIILRRLIRTAWTTHRWDTRPARRP